jgi:hypothetical protein
VSIPASPAKYIHTSLSPSETDIDDHSTDLQALLERALSRYLMGGATLVKDAPRIPRGYHRYTLNQTTRGMRLNQAADDWGNSPGLPPGAYIATLVPETQAIRYTTDGFDPVSGYGMPLAVGQYIDIAVQDLSCICVAAQASGAVVHVEFFGIYA